MIRSLNSSTGRKIAIAMSGGVDSSVAAHLLRQNYPDDELLGIHMSNWDYHGDDDVHTSSKCWEQDWKDAKNVAEHLNLPIVHTSFEADYWNSVFEPYCEQLSQSITPNPDVDCNRYIKFGVLRDYLASRYQINTLATGHYARVWNPSDDNHQPMPECLQQVLDQDPSVEMLLHSSVPTLLAARDKSKDQSYFLTGVHGDALRNVLFPLGDFLKQQPQMMESEAQDAPDSQQPLTVRQLAENAGLPTAHKRDSMGICFVGKRKHAEFVQEYIDDPTEAGNGMGRCINVEDGSIVAEFDPKKQPSLLYATIGQGAKIGGANQRWFVVDKPSPTTLLICPGTHHPALYSDTLYVKNMNWIAGQEPTQLPLRAQCRIRHLQPLVDCEIRHRSDGRDGHEIVMDEPLRGIAPGQVCALYVHDLVCLGGGAISQRGRTYMDLQRSLPEHLHPSGQNDKSTMRQ